MLDSENPDSGVEIEAAQSAPVPDADPTPAAASPETAPATSDDKPAAPETMLDAALKALGRDKDDEATAAKPAGEDTAEKPNPSPTAEAETQGDAPDDVPRLPDEVFKSLPKEARGVFAKLRSAVARLEPDAKAGAAVAEFIRTSGITPQEYVELQDAGALLKRDPAAARKILLDQIEKIDRFLGITLPDDIREDVESGYITEDRGRELSQTRARAERAEGAVQATTQQAKLDAMLSHVAKWEAETRRADPDFDRKLPNILSLTKAAATLTPARNGADAVRIAQQAYAEVNAMVASFRPAAGAVNRGPSSAASAPAVMAAPKTALEAAHAALRRGR